MARSWCLRARCTDSRPRERNAAPQVWQTCRSCGWLTSTISGISDAAASRAASGGGGALLAHCALRYLLQSWRARSAPPGNSASSSASAGGSDVQSPTGTRSPRTVRNESHASPSHVPSRRSDACTAAEPVSQTSVNAAARAWWSSSSAVGRPRFRV